MKWLTTKARSFCTVRHKPHYREPIVFSGQTESPLWVLDVSKTMTGATIDSIIRMYVTSVSHNTHVGPGPSSIPLEPLVITFVPLKVTLSFPQYSFRTSPDAKPTHSVFGINLASTNHFSHSLISSNVSLSVHPSINRYLQFARLTTEVRITNAIRGWTFTPPIQPRDESFPRVVFPLYLYDTRHAYSSTPLRLSAFVDCSVTTDMGSRENWVSLITYVASYVNTRLARELFTQMVSAPTSVYPSSLTNLKKYLSAFVPPPEASSFVMSPIQLVPSQTDRSIRSEFLSDNFAIGFSYSIPGRVMCFSVIEPRVPCPKPDSLWFLTDNVERRSSTKGFKGPKAIPSPTVVTQATITPAVVRSRPAPDI